jgi:isoleucyl-tRNA synthetase
MAMGIDKYNAECRAIVMRYASEWRVTVERMGRWIDFDNDYKTLNTPFMESEWWAMSTSSPSSGRRITPLHVYSLQVREERAC